MIIVIIQNVHECVPSNVRYVYAFKNKNLLPIANYHVSVHQRVIRVDHLVSHI